ncbi:MAG TPA: hypothetical protein VEK34_10095 [Methylocella sp.]|nr:hypothetical protein [Methylocella sp.]
MSIDPFHISAFLGSVPHSSGQSVGGSIFYFMQLVALAEAATSIGAAYAKRVIP